MESVAAHTGPIWSLAALPDGSGFVSGSADHDVKFWEWEIVTETIEGCVPRSGDAGGRSRLESWRRFAGGRT